MKAKVGVIAEDDSDVDVFIELTKKITGKESFKPKKFVGGGCGRIKSKCLRWADNFRLQGCTTVVLLHDLDNKDKGKLKRELEVAFSPCPIKNHIIIIPVQEIEAWLLSDEVAIHKALNLKHKVPKIPNPESVLDPKKRLKETIYLKSGKTKQYLNTIHNKRIASHLSLERIRRCSSFVELEDFIKKHMK